MEGKFIVFEGLDGSGLSTHAEILKEFLKRDGRPAILTKEQTITMIGGLIKSILRKEIITSPLALQLLFVADRAHHLSSEIEPALQEGKIVISDRYIFSTVAFGAFDIDMEFLKLINSKFRIPDLTFIIDAPPEVCIKRISEQRLSHLELFEEKEKLEKIRNNYMKLKDYFPNVYVINSNRPVEEVAKEIREIALKFIKKS